MAGTALKIDDDYGSIDDKEIVPNITEENIVTYESYEVEPVENNKKEFEHIISDNRDRSNYIWINKIREDIRWNNSVLQMEANTK